MEMGRRKIVRNAAGVACLLACLIAFMVSIYQTGVAEEIVAPAATYSLQQAVEKALASNYEIKQAKEELTQQGGALMEARGQNFPIIELSGSFDSIDKNRIDNFGDTTFGSDAAWSADIVLRQELYAGGKNKALWTKQEFLSAAALYHLETVINEVLLQVKERFYDVLLAHEKIDVQEQLVQLLEEELRSEQNKLEAGTVSDFNVLRAEVELSNSKTPLIQAKNSYRIALHELSKVLGLEGEGEETPLAVAGTFPEEGIAVTVTTAFAAAMKNRPELKRLAAAIEAEEQGVDVERAGYLPKVSVQAGYGADKSRFSDALDDEIHGWRAEVRGSWSLFDSYRTTGRVTQAMSRKSQAKIAYDQQRLAIDVEVRRAYSSLSEAVELLLASRKVVEQGVESLRLARARFDAGTGTQLEVLDSQVALTQARTNEVSAFHTHAVAIARMKKAMGAIRESDSDSP